jgi:hypothetical protein
LIKITNSQEEDLGFIDPSNVISKFTFNAIHEAEGSTRIILSEVDMDRFQEIMKLDLGEDKPIPRSMARKNLYHPPATIQSIETLYPEIITVDERDGVLMATGIGPGDTELELRFETGECHKIEIKVKSQQIPGLSSKLFWPMLGEFRLPQGYFPSPRECFELRTNYDGWVDWLMTDYVHNVQIRNNEAIKAVIPTVLDELDLWKVDFYIEPYTCTRNVFVDTMAVSLPQNIGTGVSGEELIWFFAEDGVKQAEFTPAVEGYRNYVLKSKDYLGEYYDVRIKHPNEPSHSTLSLTYKILPWDLVSELKNHLQIEDGQDEGGAFKNVKISSTLQDKLPARYKKLQWNAEPEQFYRCETKQNQLEQGQIKFKVYRDHQAPDYDTNLMLRIDELPEIKIPLTFDSNLDLKEEMLIDTELHLFELNGKVVSMTLQLPTSLKDLPRYDWQAKLTLGGATPSEHRIPNLEVSSFLERDLIERMPPEILKKVEMDLGIQTTIWNNIGPLNTPPFAHVEVSHPFRRPIRKEINIFSHESDWSWVDESYLNHELVRYCKKFQQRIEFKSSGHSLERELYELETSPANPFGYPTHTKTKRHLVGDSVDVQDYSFIMEFLSIEGSEPKLIRLISIEELEEELESNLFFGISSGWQNDGEPWINQEHFEKENTSIIFSESELPLDETSVTDGKYTFHSPGVYLMLRKLGAVDWYCEVPEHKEKGLDWPDAYFGCYGAVLEIEVF